MATVVVKEVSTERPSVTHGVWVKSINTRLEGRYGLIVYTGYNGNFEVFFPFNSPPMSHYHTVDQLETLPKGSIITITV